MKILITGGAGFIGSNLSKFLLKRDYEVTIVDDFSAGKLSNIKGLNVTLFKNKIEELDVKKFKDIDFIVHLAAQASVPLSIEQFYKSSSNNLLSSIKVFDIAKEFSIPIIYASSSAIYGNLPIGDDKSENIDILTPYALDKLTLESYAQLCNQIFCIPSIGFRFFNVYGPNQDPSNPYSGVISLFVSQAINQEEISIFGGQQTRDFIHVVNLCEIIEIGIKEIMNNGQSSAEILNLGSGNSICITDLAHKIKLLVKSDSPLKILPAIVGDPVRSDGDYSKLIKRLKTTNYDFISLDKGLLEVINWIGGE